jgi:hypothetical protein
LLLSLISEQINNLVSHDDIMDISLEQISVLKGVCFCASAKIENNSCLISRSYCTKGVTGFEGGIIELTQELSDQLMAGPVMIDCQASGGKDIKIPDLLTGLGLRGLLLIRTFGRMFSDNLFVFAEDLSADSLQKNRNLLYRT